jgi:cytochrome c2
VKLGYKQRKSRIESRDHGLRHRRTASAALSLLGASDNLKKYGVIWSAETQDAFVADPGATVPAMPMAGVLADPQQRADVIAYLSTLKE